MKQASIKHLLTPDDVAKQLQVTPEQVRSLIRKGLLKASNISTGRKRPLYRITSESLQNFLSRKQSKEITKTFIKQHADFSDFFPDLQ